MPRLYYEKRKVMSQASDDTDESGTKMYVEKITLLIPIEIIAAYLAVVGLIPSIQGVEPTTFYQIMFVLFLLITTWYIYMVREKKEAIPIPHMIISTIAFIVWGFATTGDKVFPHFHQPAIASIILIVFTLISGKIPLR